MTAARDRRKDGLMDSSTERPSPRQRMRRWMPTLICALVIAWILLLTVLISDMPTVEK
jgi:hypothetical protein